MRAFHWIRGPLIPLPSVWTQKIHGLRKERPSHLPQETSPGSLNKGFLPVFVKLRFHYSFLHISDMPLPYHLISVFPFVNKTIVAVFSRLTLLVRAFPPKLFSVWHTWKWKYAQAHWGKQMRLLVARGNPCRSPSSPGPPLPPDRQGDQYCSNVCDPLRPHKEVGGSGLEDW